MKEPLKKGKTYLVIGVAAMLIGGQLFLGVKIPNEIWGLVGLLGVTMLRLAISKAEKNDK